MVTAASREILLVAFDPSADGHGARVLKKLQENYQARAFGLGGPALQAAGMEITARADRLAAVGISEATHAAVQALRLWRVLESEARRRRPAAALLMDAPDFNLPLARRLKRLDIPVVYYIAPQAWAWRRRRVKKLKQRVRRLCVILPFEEQFFRGHGLDAEYVGHPLMEEQLSVRDNRPGRVLVLPGSRRHEVKRLLPLLCRTAELLGQRHPQLVFQLPLAPGLERAWVEELLRHSSFEVEIEPAGARACLAGACLALCASGTVTLEAALAGVPQVVCYRLSWLSYLLARLLVRVEHASLVNLLLGERLVPEFIQNRVRPELMAEAGLGLLENETARARMLDGYRRLHELLGQKRPAQRVARILAEVAGW